MRYLALVFFLVAVPAQAQEAVIAFVCAEQGHAEALAGEMTEHNVQQRDPRWMTCNPLMSPIADMSDAPSPMMVLTDWEDDPFGLYAVNDVFLIVYWINGYKPAGQSL
jgi:hypothetical protein